MVQGGIINQWREFPDSPVVRTPCFPARGTKIPHAKKKKKKSVENDKLLKR